MGTDTHLFILHLILTILVALEASTHLEPRTARPVGRCGAGKGVLPCLSEISSPELVEE